MIKKDFEKECIEQFGYNSNHLKYILHDYDSRLKRLEIDRDHLNPIIGASIAKAEALIMLMAQDSVDSNQFIKKLETLTENFIVSSKKQYQLEKK